ncbi:MAG: hypothetical protein OXB93_03415 [Cytophagales bacterium]|nr:hypothetical protein [Cytophagales bacterium]
MKDTTSSISDKIAVWKKQHGTVYEISVEGKKGFFKAPDRAILGYAMSNQAQDPLSYHEIIARNCWLGGDELLLSEDKLFLSLCTRLGELVEIKEAALKKW